MMAALWVFAAVVLIFGFVVAFGAPYVPSLRKELRQAFTKLYVVTTRDVIVDLGSGDGQVLLEAAKHGARAYGFELNPVLVFISRLRLAGRAQISLANMWNGRLPGDTTLVYCFAVSRDSRRLVKYLQAESHRLGRPIKVITFGSGLKGLTPLDSLNAHQLYEVEPLPRH
jgi:hypothetical protein